MLYGVFRAIFWVIFHVFFDVRVQNIDDIPEKGPLIVCSNHMSWWDPPLVATVFPRKVHFMAKKELFRHSVSSYVFKRLGAFPVDRNKSDIKSIRTALRILKEGKVLGIFPEGTRHKDSETVGEIYGGAALLGLKGPSRVVPLVIRGSYKFRGKINVTLGPPITVDAVTGRPASDVALGTQKIQGAMKALWDMGGD